MVSYPGQITGNATISGNLTVGGTTTLAGNVQADENLSCTNDLSAGGNATFVGAAVAEDGLFISTAGTGLSVKEGVNAKMGTATLNGVTEVTIPTSAVGASSRVFLSIESPAGTIGGLAYVSSRIPGTSFGIKGIVVVAGFSAPSPAMRPTTSPASIRT